MIELTPAITNYLTLLLGRLELYRKTDIAELDLKQRNGLHDIRSKVKALLDREVPLSSACPLTDTLMTLWLERQQGLALEICRSGRNEMAPQDDQPLEADLDPDLHDVEEKAFHKILNDQSTTEKLKDIKQLFTLVNEICLTLKEEQTEVRRLKTTGGRQYINENTLIANLRQCTTEELAAPSVAGRVYVDCLISQLNDDCFEVPISPLLAAHSTNDVTKSKSSSGAPISGGGDTPPGMEPRSCRHDHVEHAAGNIYDNVVSFESEVIIHEIPISTAAAEVSAAAETEFDHGRLEEFAAAADASILRPIGRRPRVKFNTRKELQENALLGLCCDEPLGSPGSQKDDGVACRRLVISKSSSDVMGRRRMSISSRFQSNMDEISDELRGLNEWKNNC